MKCYVITPKKNLSLIAWSKEEEVARDYLFQLRRSKEDPTEYAGIVMKPKELRNLRIDYGEYELVLVGKGTYLPRKYVPLFLNDQQEGELYYETIMTGLLNIYEYDDELSEEELKTLQEAYLIVGKVAKRHEMETLTPSLYEENYQNLMRYRDR